MSTFVVVSGIPLSSTTRDAWKSVGGMILRRGSDTNRVLSIAEHHDYVLNLGRSGFRPWRAGEWHTPANSKFWNHGSDIQDLVWPGTSRRLFHDLMPPRPTEFPADVWIKTPGRAGRGKFHKQVDHELHLPTVWDWQEHVEGEEFRVITVGRRIVQDFRRKGSNGDRVYEWMPMIEVPTSIKSLVREAASRLPQNTVIAWDMILTEDNVPYLFEGNTCPGMSVVTAQRIVKEIDRQRRGE